MKISKQHERGLIAHLKDLTGAGDEAIAAFLADLFGDAITYEDLSTVSLAAVSEAVRGTNLKVPVTRRETIARLLNTVRARTNICDRCGRMPFVFDGGTVLSSTRCMACDGGVFVKPEATTFLGWADGASYAIGTTHDTNGCPITDEAVAGEREVSSKTAEALRESVVSLVVYLAALLRFGKVRTPAAALTALSQWGTAFVSVAETRAFVVGLKGATVKSIYGGRVPEELIEARDVAADINPVTPPIPPASRSVPMTHATPEELRRARKALREKFVRCYATSTKVRQIASDAGIITSRIGWDQAAEYLWLDVLAEAEMHDGVMQRLLAIAREDYPGAGF